MKGQDWTKEELEQLQEHYGKIPTKELQEKYLPNRTPQSVRRKASEFGIASTGAIAWSEEDDEILRKYYGKISNEELRKKYLPNRTLQAIWSRASSSGIGLTKEPDWSEEDVEILRKYYGKMPNEELRGKYLSNRTIPAIVGKAGILGIGSTRNPGWTKEEDEILQKYYGKMPNEELQRKYLLNRTIIAIKTRARSLGAASKRNSTEAKKQESNNTASANPTSASLPTIHIGSPFTDWLSQNTGLSESAISAYTDAVGTISKEMHQKGTIPKPLENMSAFEFDFAISLIISDTDFVTKNGSGKPIYSHALKQYRYFLNTITEDSGGHSYMEKIENDSQIPETEKTAIIQSRIGQGVFRKSLIDKYNGRCIITGIEHPKLLVASHIKPWAASSNKERLSVNNGLLLSATYDRLFDSGLITFDRYGKIFLSSLIGAENIKRLGLSQGMRFDLKINKIMEEYLSYHRDVLFVE